MTEKLIKELAELANQAYWESYPSKPWEASVKAIISKIEEWKAAGVDIDKGGDAK